MQNKVKSFLVEIVEKKREDVKKIRIKKQESRSKEKKRMTHDSLFMIPRNEIALIAEIKFASPTNPSLGSKKELLDRAKMYEEAGADAISIITEPHFFKGDVAFVSQVKNEVSIPILQKDFVIDEKQIYQAKEIGSDALLLIARLVDKQTLQHFVELCFAEGIEPVVEVNNNEDLEKALATETNIIAVNARDLETFDVDVTRACELIKQIPNNFIKLGFSGINSKEEVAQYKKAGAKGVLVGTALMITKNIHGFIADLRGVKISENQSTIRENHNNVKVKICGIRTLENAQVAIAAGADFLGFNFVPTSKRYINPKEAKNIIDKVRKEQRAKSKEQKIMMVGVFQNQLVDEVNKISYMLDLDFVQLHGEEDEEYMKKVKKPIIKKVNHESRIMNHKGNFLILDRRIQGEGEMVDLDRAKQLSKKFPIFFSGGLIPENVSGIVKKVRPFAVDVAGGIETDGEIDSKKMKLFIENVKGVVI